MGHCENPFSLNGALGLQGPLRTFAEATLERVSGLKTLNRMYAELPPAADCQEFLRIALDRLGVDYRVRQNELSRIPLKGAAVVVANHPFGGIEGMILAHLFRGMRSDVKIVANAWLKRLPPLTDLFIPVDVFGGKGAVRRNARAMKEAMNWLKQGGLIVVFPAGAVSHFDPFRGGIADPEWQPSIGRLIRHAEADVVPLYIDGHNNALFQAAGLIHPVLRTVMLPRQLLARRSQTVDLRIGATIPFNRIRHLTDHREFIDHLRLRTYMLQDVHRNTAESVSKNGPGHVTQEPVAAAVASGEMQWELSLLPPGRRLAAAGDLEVWYAKREEVPLIVQEIGRLREITFRAVGEGTGNACDLDLYDNYYLHLFVWQRTKQEVVGAYRLGLGDEILQRYDKKGFYTHSLFRYSRRLLQRINPAIELGRSFVRPEYQRSFSPLLLLWCGIGAFVAAHPKYRILFGPVSISNAYDSLSRQLMVSFLRDNNYLPELARMVRPRRPFRGGRRMRPEYAQIRDIESLSELIGQIEGDAKGAPILLKQYLKLGGRLLGFNVDRQFADALDGLIMVDLLETEPKVLERYMGKEQAARFVAYHQGKKSRGLLTTYPEGPGKTTGRGSQ